MGHLRGHFVGINQLMGGHPFDRVSSQLWIFLNLRAVRPPSTYPRATSLTKMPLGASSSAKQRKHAQSSLSRYSKLRPEDVGASAVQLPIKTIRPGFPWAIRRFAPAWAR